jgi:saccharopine dehydrogenase-like NADP-dependent oxidoreductase
MKVLLLGVGMQGKAALYDLANSSRVTEVVAADQDVKALRGYTARIGIGEAVRCVSVDASQESSLEEVFEFGPDVVVDLLPIDFIPTVIEACLRHGAHLVNTYYATPEVKAFASQAAEQGIRILPEFGLDPGLDLVMLGQALQEVEDVKMLRMYGAGIPEPEAADNAIRYKVSWTMDGVLRSYYRSARIVLDGEVMEIPPEQIFSPENVHMKRIGSLGELEAFPNEDALAYVEGLNLDWSQVVDAGRYTLRWPGHCAFWKKVVDLHLLDPEPVEVEGMAVDRRAFLSAAMEPHLRYGPDEGDLAIVRVEVRGSQSGRPLELVYQLIDARDPGTGFTAMSRTVGFTASIGAQMLASGEVSRPGILSPARDIPYERLATELIRRGIHIQREINPLE